MHHRLTKIIFKESGQRGLLNLQEKLILHNVIMQYLQLLKAVLDIVPVDGR